MAELLYDSRPCDPPLLGVKHESHATGISWQCLHVSLKALRIGGSCQDGPVGPDETTERRARSASHVEVLAAAPRLQSLAPRSRSAASLQKSLDHAHRGIIAPQAH
eukprot:TRINITY_DN28589_c0_g1_i2.p1 TRINITY_DN28589_c0_g1~~TRINITY_DN28589_c0_g1_i2.p1  ORF type:complete len:106 (-),score=7.52 TRINITY_DN28589_c0_g1_i2:14-331(-)